MMNARVALLVILSVVAASAEEGEKAGGFVPPTQPSGDVYFFETFNDEETFDNKWVRSAAKKEGVAEDVSKYDGEWAIEAATGGSFPEDKGLVMKSASKHHAIAAKLDRQFSFEAKDMFVVQYEVNFQKGMGCGGAYMKLLSDNDSLKLDSFYDKTPYTIMFGPDKCGADSKLHFIFRHKNPLTGSFEEKHAKPSSKLTFFDDRKTHLFTLVVRSDNTYSIMVDQFSVNEGSLLEDFTPPVNPDKEIDDPEDSKPDDWDEREKIPDPDASKPDDWDEDAPAKIPDMDVEKPEGWLDDGPEFIPDPESSKPEDWDDEMDGDWEPPMIPNPACQEVGCGEWKRPLKNNPDYKGKWSAPMIENPNYKGIWKPRRIPNPNFFGTSTHSG